MKKINITIDGPVASGKGTTGKLLSKELGYIYFDSGAVYRAIAYFLREQKISEKDHEKILENLKDVKITFNDRGEVILNSQNMEQFIRNPDISHFASVYSTNNKIRDFVTKITKKLITEKGYILDGRDAAAVLCPNAELKIYLDASLEQRAKRRYSQYRDGLEITFEKVKKDIQERDERDSDIGRKGEGALKILTDSIVVDTSDMTIPEQVSYIKKLSLEKINKEDIV